MSPEAGTVDYVPAFTPDQARQQAAAVLATVTAITAVFLVVALWWQPFRFSPLPTATPASLDAMAQALDASLAGSDAIDEQRVRDDLDHALVPYQGTGVQSVVGFDGREIAVSARVQGSHGTVCVWAATRLGAVTAAQQSFDESACKRPLRAEEDVTGPMLDRRLAEVQTAVRTALQAYVDVHRPPYDIASFREALAGLPADAGSTPRRFSARPETAELAVTVAVPGGSSCVEGWLGPAGQLQVWPDKGAEHSNPDFAFTAIPALTAS